MVHLDSLNTKLFGSLMETRVRVADEVWIATASLHRERPGQTDFTIGEIVAQAESASLTGVTPLRAGVKVHIYLHCVANKPPNPGRYRMLLETSTGRRRLFRPGDPCHPLRIDGKSVPKRDEIPAGCRNLIDWYLADYAADEAPSTEDPILALHGAGRGLWKDEDADAYVRRLRADWQ